MAVSNGWRGRIGWLGAELVIIVLGVSIGLGVDEWRSNRSQAALRDQYLEQLTAELQVNLIRVAHLQAWAEKTEAHGSVLLADLRAEPVQVLDDDVALALAHLSFALQVTFVTAAFESLTAGSGPIALSPSVRQDLWVAYDQLARWEGYYLNPPIAFSSMVRGLVPVEAVTEMRSSGPDCYRHGGACSLTPETLARLRTGVQRLRSNETALSALNEYLFWANRFQGAITGLPQRIEEVVEAVAASETGRDAP